MKAQFLQRSTSSGFGCNDDLSKQKLSYDPAAVGWQNINFDVTTAMLRYDAAIAAEMVNEYFLPFCQIETDNKVRFTVSTIDTYNGFFNYLFYYFFLITYLSNFFEQCYFSNDCFVISLPILSLSKELSLPLFISRLNTMTG